MQKANHIPPPRPGRAHTQPVDDEPETPCDNLLDVLGDMGQLVGTLQGAIILGVPRASTPARAATTQLLSVVNSAVDVVQGAYESTDACQTNPDTAVCAPPLHPLPTHFRAECIFHGRE